MPSRPAPASPLATPSELCKIQPDSWLAEYTTELLNVLHVLGRLVELEDAQRDLLEKICSGPTISAAELKESEALAVPDAWRKLTADSNAPRNLFPAGEGEND